MSFTGDDTERICGISEPLLSWYYAQARDLPWRSAKDPYAIWVSEIMLQQTRVETVKPYYERFLNTLPTVYDLAGCPDEKLLKLWEGLGYYSRVRNMKKAAEVICRDYGGCLPADAASLRKLPGIGPYTAGAVSSIAFHRAEPAVDGNVMRILARLTGDPSNILEPSVRKRMENLLRRCMPGNDPGSFNQALMDLGAMVCRSGPLPDCGSCPVRDRCRAAEEKLTDLIPVRYASKEKKKQLWTVLLLYDTRHVLLRQRPERGLLAGMYEFPALSGHLDRNHVLKQVQESGLRTLRIRVLPPARHVFTHIEWQMAGFAVRCEDFDESGVPAGMTAATPGQVRDQYAVPSAYGAYLEMLGELITDE